MKPTILAAVALLAGAATPALANHTPANFESVYTQIVNDASKAGSHIQTRCWKHYCVKSMDVQYRDGYSIAFKVTYDNGEEAHNFCQTKDANLPDRRCWWSTGLITDEHFDGTIWNTARTIAKAFEDENASGADASL